MGQTLHFDEGYTKLADSMTHAAIGINTNMEFAVLLMLVTKEEGGV